MSGDTLFPQPYTIIEKDAITGEVVIKMNYNTLLEREKIVAKNERIDPAVEDQIQAGSIEGTLSNEEEIEHFFNSL